MLVQKAEEPKATIKSVAPVGMNFVKEVVLVPATSAAIKEFLRSGNRFLKRLGGGALTERVPFAPEAELAGCLYVRIDIHRDRSV